VEARNRELVQGTLEMPVLKTPTRESMHGYGIALPIEQISNGVFRVHPGSLLPALSRMERSWRICREWRSTENNRRAKCYAATAAGRKALAQERRQWGRPIAAIHQILEASKEGEKCCGT
jgi:PadR family transcriptional regulator, regulatory protein PadR